METNLETFPKSREVNDWKSLAIKQIKWKRDFEAELREYAKKQKENGAISHEIYAIIPIKEILGE